MSDSDYAVGLSNVSNNATTSSVSTKIKGTTAGGADLKTPTQLRILTCGTGSAIDTSLVSVAIIDKNSSSGGGSGDSGATQEHGEYTPAITNLTLGNGTQKAVYTKTDDMVTFKITIKFGSTTKFTGTATGVTNGIPFPPHEDWLITPVSGYILDSGSGYYSAYTAISSSGNSNLGYIQCSNPPVGGSSIFTETTPIPWTTNDQLIFTGTYRIKS